VPKWIPTDRVSIVPPSIDPFSPKNQELSAAQRQGILAAMGVLDGPSGGATFTRRDGSAGSVTRRVSVVAEGPLDATAPLVIQVSRWDHLKDMAGVMAGFADRVVSHGGAQLALVGPAVDSVSDDPEGREVLEQCIEAWSVLSPQQRRRIRLLILPMDDGDENAAMVNALQRHATIIVQKSLAEGFGLTVAEGMWKAKAVVASAVGGIVDQVAPGTGVLLDDPLDLVAFGDTLASLIDRGEDVVRLGENARRHVLESFVGDKHLLQYGALMERLKAH
jgi:trehalose synthase